MITHCLVQAALDFLIGDTHHPELVITLVHLLILLLQATHFAFANNDEYQDIKG